MRFFSALDSIQAVESSRDKFTSSEIMLNLSDIYGENLLNKVMGREAVNDSCINLSLFALQTFIHFQRVLILEVDKRGLIIIA